MDKKLVRQKMISGIDTHVVDDAEFVKFVSERVQELLQQEIQEIARSGINKNAYIDIVRAEIHRFCDQDDKTYIITRRRVKRGTVTVKSALVFIVSRIMQQCQNATASNKH